MIKMEDSRETDKPTEKRTTETTVTPVIEPIPALEEEVANGHAEDDVGLEEETAATSEETAATSEETAATSEEGMELTVELDIPATLPDSKEDNLTPEEVSAYDETRKSVQDDLVNTTKTVHGRKRKTPDELKALSTRNYLDETVVPHLLVGMSELSRRRPDKPLEWLAKFLEREQEKESGDSENGRHQQNPNSKKSDAEKTSKDQETPENHEHEAVLAD
jgi:hypothetical protein